MCVFPFWQPAGDVGQGLEAGNVPLLPFHFAHSRRGHEPEGTRAR